MSAHAAWVEARTPVAPERLTARVVEVLASRPDWEALPVADALLAAGDVLLANVMAERGGAPRAAALDLLAADACVTWAFEAAADAPTTLAARAESAMRRITEAAA